MPVDFQQFQNDLDTIKDKLIAFNDKLDQVALAGTNDKPLSVKEAAEFLGIAEQTIYQHVKRLRPRKRFGKLYFFKAELLAYLEGKEGSHE